MSPHPLNPGILASTPLRIHLHWLLRPPAVHPPHDQDRSHWRGQGRLPVVEEVDGGTSVPWPSGSATVEGRPLHSPVMPELLAVLPSLSHDSFKHSVVIPVHGCGSTTGPFSFQLSYSANSRPSFVLPIIDRSPVYKSGSWGTSG